MFDYCDFELHDLEGKLITEFRELQVSIACLGFRYKANEHGMFYNNFKRLRSTSLYLTGETGDIHVKFNIFGVIYWIGFRSFDYSKGKYVDKGNVNIRKDYVKQFNMDNIKEDLMMYPTRFKIKLPYYKRLGYYILDQYYEAKFFLKYDAKRKYSYKFDRLVSKLTNWRKK